MNKIYKFAAIGTVMLGVCSSAMAEDRSTTIVPYDGDSLSSVACMQHSATGSRDNPVLGSCSADWPFNYQPIERPQH